MLLNSLPLPGQSEDISKEFNIMKHVGTKTEIECGMTTEIEAK